MPLIAGSPSIPSVHLEKREKNCVSVPLWRKEERGCGIYMDFQYEFHSTSSTEIIESLHGDELHQMYRWIMAMQ